MHFRKNFGGAGLFNAAYTWSKYLTDNGSDRSNAPQNSYNWHEGEYGPSPGDRKQVLTLNYVYRFRSSRESAWQGRPSKTGRFQHHFLLLGAPFTVSTSSFDSAGLGSVGNSSSSARPDMICDPNATP